MAYLSDSEVRATFDKFFDEMVNKGLVEDSRLSKRVLKLVFNEGFMANEKISKKNNWR